MDFRKNEATRHLCVAAHSDRSFRDFVIEQLIDEKYKAFAQSVGVDLPTVVKHCLGARRLASKRELLLSLLALPFLISALIILGSSRLSRGCGLALVLSLLGGFIIIFWDDWNTRKRILSRFMRDNFDPDSNDLFLDGEDSRRVAELEQWQKQNVVVYSGFQPFVGSGDEIGGWSFALNLRKGKDDLGSLLAPDPISIPEMYAYIDKAVLDLNLEKLVTEDKLYVNGRDIRNDKRFLSSPLSRPFSCVTQGVIERTYGKSLQNARHYKCIRIIDWSGDSILSVFLGITCVSDNISITARYFFLPPIAEKYRVADSWNRNPKWSDWARSCLTALISSPFALAAAPFYSLSNLSGAMRKRKARKKLEKEILENPMFDYGASMSVRQFASAPIFQRYFQKLDREMYYGILEHQLLDKVIEFLDKHNIDTSDLRERKTTILNNGVFMSGGSIQAQSMAVGKEAKSLVGRLMSGSQSEKQAA
jgi:hypothetical protein